MEYFVPAWHSQLQDWSSSIPTIDNYDATRAMQVLEDNNYQIGLIITDYQPQLSSKLNQLSYVPQNIFSIYDYLQGINSFESKTIELADFNWPKDAIVDFSPFHTLIIIKDQLYAKVFYDINGRILKIEYIGNQEIENYTLLMDSRGFISSKITPKETIYYDPYGQWRFKQEKNSGQVTINSKFKFCKNLNYSNISDLINEIFQAYLKDNFNFQKDHLIVTLDDQTTIDSSKFNKKTTFFILNKDISYKNELANINEGHLIISDQTIANEIIKNYGNKFKLTIIPEHNAEFKLGHSARQSTQEIAFFAENIEAQEAKKLILKLCNYIAKSPKDKSLKIFTYDIWQANRLNQVIEQIKQENSENFTITKDDEEIENVNLEDTDDNKKIPSIKVEHQRLTNISQLLNLLDTTRVLINYGKADELMQMAAISIGIPQLQNFASPVVINGKNGYVFKEYDELITYIDHYLNDLNAWNNALVYNVQFMNRYSETNIMKKWKTLLENSQED